MHLWIFLCGWGRSFTDVMLHYSANLSHQTKAIIINQHLGMGVSSNQAWICMIRHWHMLCFPNCLTAVKTLQRLTRAGKSSDTKTLLLICFYFLPVSGSPPQWSVSAAGTFWRRRSQCGTSGCRQAALRSDLSGLHRARRRPWHLWWEYKAIRLQKLIHTERLSYKIPEDLEMALDRKSVV